MGSRLSYFTVDITPGAGEEFIQYKYGFAGVGIMLELYRKMFINGHFILWDDDICSMYAAKWDCEELPEIVETMKRYDLIDPAWMEKGIMTSFDVQKQIMSIRKKSAESLNFKYPADKILSEESGDFRRKAEKSGEKRKKAEKSGIEREREREIDREIDNSPRSKKELTPLEKVYALFKECFEAFPDNAERTRLKKLWESYGQTLYEAIPICADKCSAADGDLIDFIEKTADEIQRG